MIAGIGVDVLRYERIKEEILDPDDAFVRRIFTAKEIEDASRREDRQQYFTGLYAAKEAVFKALRLQADEVEFSEIEVSRNAYGAPEVSFLGKMRRYADENGIQMSLSLSYESDFATAFAVCERQLPGLM